MFRRILTSLPMALFFIAAPMAVQSAPGTAIAEEEFDCQVIESTAEYDHCMQGMP